MTIQPGQFSLWKTFLLQSSSLVMLLRHEPITLSLSICSAVRLHCTLLSERSYCPYSVLLLEYYCFQYTLFRFGYKYIVLKSFPVLIVALASFQMGEDFDILLTVYHYV
jgi:hypothetical protein